MKGIALRYPATCATCSRGLAVGERAAWDSATRRTTCLTISSVALADEVAVLGAQAIACLNVRDRTSSVSLRNLRTAHAYGDRPSPLSVAMKKSPLVAI